MPTIVIFSNAVLNHRSRKQQNDRGLDPGTDPPGPLQRLWLPRCQSLKGLTWQPKEKEKEDEN